MLRHFSSDHQAQQPIFTEPQGAAVFQPPTCRW
jgi:hypothetical protein